MSFDDGLIHSCIITHKIPDPSGNVDAYGQPLYTESQTPSSCRFFKKEKFRKSGVFASNNIEHVAIPISALFLPETNIAKNDTVTTTEPRYAGTYSVFDVETADGMNEIHHLVVNLERVEP